VISFIIFNSMYQW